MTGTISELSLVCYANELQQQGKHLMPGSQRLNVEIKKFEAFRGSRVQVGPWFLQYVSRHPPNWTRTQEGFIVPVICIISINNSVSRNPPTQCTAL